MPPEHIPLDERRNRLLDLRNAPRGALSEQSRPALVAVFGRFSIRALWVACLLTLVSMAANYIAFAGGEDDEQSMTDPVVEVLSAS